ncbi:MAG TPA: hypothetical protein GX522_00805 [Firmicutes bacterium]|nr:hypothetical protein [Bacillota bacterium]
MRLFGLRLDVIIIVFLIFFVAIFALRLLLNYYLITKPLEALLIKAELLDYSFDKTKLTLVWDGKKPNKIIELLQEKPVKKRFKEIELILCTEDSLELWQEEELIIREAIRNNQYYTALIRLREFDEDAKIILYEDYLYVSMLNQGQLYSLREEKDVSLRLISKVVTANE